MHTSGQRYILWYTTRVKKEYTKKKNVNKIVFTWNCAPGPRERKKISEIRNRTPLPSTFHMQCSALWIKSCSYIIIFLCTRARTSRHYSYAKYVYNMCVYLIFILYCRGWDYYYLICRTVSSAFWQSTAIRPPF